MTHSKKSRHVRRKKRPRHGPPILAKRIKKLRYRKPTRKKVGVNILLSYPKCGRNWVKYILPAGNLRFSHDGSDIPKAVDASQWETKLKVNKNKVILLVREPKDVLVSSFFAATKHSAEGKKFKGNISEFIRDPRIGLPKITVFYNTWLSKIKKYENHLIIKYEDLHSDFVGTVRELFEFLSIKKTDEELEKIKEETTIEKLREKITGKDLHQGQRKALMKLRRGMAGTFGEYLSKEDIEYCNEYISKYLLFDYDTLKRKDQDV